MPSTNTEYPWPTATGKLEFLQATSTEQPDLVLENVTPARRDWLPDLLEGLLPWMVDAVQEVAERHDPKLLHEPRTGVVPETLVEGYAVEAVSGWYAYAAAEFAARMGQKPPEEWPSRQSDDRPSALDTLVKVGMGFDELNTSIEHLEPGPVQLIAIAPTTPRVSLLLEDSAWRNTQRDQRKAGLKTIAILSKTCAIDLVASPSLEKFLQDRHPEWVETYLTESTNTPPTRNSTSVSVDSEVDPQSVFETLQDLTPGGGKIRLLAAIPSEKDEYREVRDLKADGDLGLSSGTITPYCQDLEKHGLLTIHQRVPYNVVTLTPGGRYAQGLLTEDMQIHHPQQSRLTDDLTADPQQHTGIVSGATAAHPIEEGQPLEACLEVDAGGIGQPSTRRLSLDSCWLSEQELVDLLAAGKCARGVSLVNDRIAEFDDGRTTYLGHSEGEVHVAVQWGDPIPTLVRLGSALLSETAFDRILTPSRVDPLLAGTTAFDTLRLGRQLGWLSDAEQNYDDLRKRYEQVSASLLSRLGSRNESRATWSRLCSEAHGFLATATNLYDAAGLDLTIHVRVPDTDQLAREDARYNRFISFLKNTVPKSAAYRGNSAPRMLLEKDGDKLGYRLPVDIDDTDRDADLTADWVITGPDVTSFRDDLVEAFDSIGVREQVASGIEKGIRIPIEISAGNTFPNLQGTVETLLDRLGRTLDDSLDVPTVTRLYLYAFGNLTHKSLTCSPFTIAEALIAADRLTPQDAPLTTPTLVQGLGAIDSKKIYPWLPPTSREFMRVLFKTDTPLKRSEILEAADISQTSYERHRGNLGDSGLFVESETHHYEASIPGQWPQNALSSSAGDADADVQRWVTYQKLLDAQVKAQSVVSSLNPSQSMTRVYIG